MNKTQVLVVSLPTHKNHNLLQWVTESMLYTATFASSDEKAIEVFQQQQFDIVVADNTGNDLDVRKLSAVLPILQTEAELVVYEGEPVSELQAKVVATLIRKRNQRMKRYLVLDSSGSNVWNSPVPFSAS